ncbi:hypothetical protein D8I24_0007 (plasmid) [Cupriavidus necator H850]|uniref:hypothetical protein n=1 Tax=Cupriavidus necator TaxID=106590 RepID=UPI003FA4BB15|nr:hypothetical protein D8I24_0007 [Cupriavidus necator H850]
MTVRLCERDALADLPVLLRLVDQGKAQVSEKTSLPGTVTLRLLCGQLSGSDDYSDDAGAERLFRADVMKSHLVRASKRVCWNCHLGKQRTRSNPWPRVNYAALAKRKSPSSPRSRQCRQPRSARFIRGLGTKVSPRRRRKLVGRGHAAQ